MTSRVIRGLTDTFPRTVASEFTNVDEPAYVRTRLTKASLSAFNNSPRPIPISLAKSFVDGAPALTCDTTFFEALITSNINAALRENVQEIWQRDRQFIDVPKEVKLKGERLLNLLHMSTGDFRSSQDTAEVAMQAKVRPQPTCGKGNVIVGFRAPPGLTRGDAETSNTMALGGGRSASREQAQADAEKPEVVGPNDDQSTATPGSPGSAPRGTSLQAGWSVGMAGHPTSCTECHFYVFNPGGCRSGADCKYCHAVHPRKSKKKTRRIIRRLVGEVDAHLASKDAPVGPGTPTRAVEDCAVAPQVTQTRGADEPGTCPPSSGPDPQKPISLSYSQRPLVLEVGQAVSYAPRLAVEDESWPSLADAVSFVAKPQLPKGLSVHPKTGLISGAASQVQERPSVHTITVLVDATASGVSLGKVSLASCSVAIHATAQ